MSAKFEADATFIIKGRGLVLTGWVLEGKIKPGMVLSIPAFPQKLSVLGFEFISRARDLDWRPDMIGLRFPLGSNQNNLLWKNLDVNGQIFEIIDVES